MVLTHLIKGKSNLGKAPLSPPPLPNKAIPADEDDKTSLKINLPATKPVDYSMWKYPHLSLFLAGSSEKADRGDIHKKANLWFP